MSAFFLAHPKETDLALFAGGESGPFARWRIERHVENCPQCRQIAADFFRLPDQLNELADLPSVDWKQMAMAIEAGVRADAAAAQPARPAGFLPPLAWQAGLVAASVVAGVVVARYANQSQPEPELVAAAKIEAPAPAAQVDEQPEIVEAEPARAAVAAAAAQSKGVETRQGLASDIAAPAAPPPPPPAAFNEAGSRRVTSTAQPVAAEAESAEARLRNDAAARVGAVSALAVRDQAGGFPEKDEAAQRSVEAVNFDGAPLSVLSGYSLFSRVGIQTPRVVVTNETGKTISGFALVWIVGDGAYQSRTEIVLQDLTMAPGAVIVTGEGDQWRSPSNAPSRMRIFLSSVAFEDGTTWSPASADIASKGLSAPVGVQELHAVGPNF